MKWLEQAWYRDKPGWLGLAAPLEHLFRRLAQRRRQQLQPEAWQAPVPVLVVGNISLGGTGKTPLTQALVRWLQAQGWRVGIVSRGYGGQGPFPLWVTAQTQAMAAGDEPCLLARSLKCPLVVSPQRVEAVKLLLAQAEVDIIVADDGLQHYRLGRQLEIAVIDGSRGLGNGHCLPVGPLREPAQRLAEVDFCVVNGPLAKPLPIAVPYWPMQLQPGELQSVGGQERQPLAALQGQSVYAMAGIGHPQRFFATLEAAGLKPIPLAKPDHYAYQPHDLQPYQDLPLLMTSKDAVKCQAFAPANAWYLPVEAQLPAEFWQALQQRLATVLKVDEVNHG